MPALGTGPARTEGRRLSWAVVVLTLATITSSSLSALSLYQVLALQAEVEGLRTEVSRRREQQQTAPGENLRGPQAQQQEDNKNKAESMEQTATVVPPGLRDVTERQKEELSLNKRSLGEVRKFQPCLQMMADNKKKIFQKEFALQQHIGVPWHTGLKRGEALEQDNNTMLVKEEGFFFIYSQVYYKDPTYAMGHIVIRMKKNVVGDESQHVVLFRCIQSMNMNMPFNTCYTGGLVKLEAGDRVELLIPRSTANISLDGDSTFLGAIKLD
ncbi:tumor necrosis factor ligand superfamily member 13B isoform X2 [Hoplias malabaricus]|uniref:tumor necrosis factor ligand superfamily member 13B isoform X2 n=1 Tax=Hoplias malabaricus TaxID=27720 RepID=UPI003462E20E